MNKQRKQKSKDSRKRINKKKSVNEKNKNPRNNLPNIKPVPKNLEHLVNEGDKIYTVPGDGACGPSSASAFLFKDEVFGPQLKRNMNKFMARHWEKSTNLRLNVLKTTHLKEKLGVVVMYFLQTPR